jgi:hypothetical protein
MMVNSGKACLASESFLGLDMTIPTEPIGSIPRPQKVITAFEQYERGSLSREEFESICSEAVRETVEKLKPPDHRLSLTVSRLNPVSPLIRSTVYPT